MNIPTNELISPCYNINPCSTDLKSHSNVRTYNTNLKLLMSPLFIVLPKDGIMIKTATNLVTKLHQSPLKGISRKMAYELDLPMIKNDQTSLDVSDISIGMDTVNSVMLFLKSKNYANEFYVNGDGSIILKNEIYHQNEIKLVKIYRFEGDSNPSDEAIIYLIKADSGPYGYSLDGYGISSNHDHDQYVEFIRRLSFQKLV